MKKILRRSTLIYIVALAFIGGLGYLAFELVTGADDWVDQAYNAHIAGDGGLAQAGAIYDRNGTALAQTVDGKRVYNESESVRKSLLHVVGDDSLNISTAVQSMYRSQLIGYNLVFGLNMPESLRASHDIKLTVDSATCAAAYDVLAAYNKKGACVIYNYKTGEVICSISTMAYDPQAPPEITEDNESEYEGGFVVSFPELPGCIACGDTIESAVANAENAKKAWFEAAFESGVVIHEPDSLEEYSGQFKLRIPKSLHRSLAEHSKKEGISMNQYCVYLLAKNDAVYSK